MSNLAVKGASSLAQRLGMNESQLELIRRACVHADAPDDVLELYLFRCKSLGVDPMDKMIYCIPRQQRVQDARGNWGSETRWTFQNSIDLFRSVAEDSGDYAGQLGPFYTGDGVTWVEVWLAEQPPLACKIGVLRNSFKEPLWVTGTYAYYVPRDRAGNPAPTAFWKGEKGAHQLAKCVEELALRKAFPRKLHGLYGNDEMEQADKAPMQRAAEPAAQVEAEDANFTALPAETPPQAEDPVEKGKALDACSNLRRERFISAPLWQELLKEVVPKHVSPKTGTISEGDLSVAELRAVWREANKRTKPNGDRGKRSAHSAGQEPMAVSEPEYADELENELPL